MFRFTLTAITLCLLAGCSKHRSQRNPTSPALEPAPPLVRSDRDVFEGDSAGKPAPPSDGAGAGGTSGQSGVGIGNGGGGAGGGRGAAVPEPGTMLLVGTGLAAAAFSRRRRKAATP